MKRKVFKMTNSELEMMEVLWMAERPLTKTEIVAASEDRSWKASYIHRMLNSLLEKKIIKVVGSMLTGNTYSRLFAPAMTPEEYSVLLIKNNALIDEASIKTIIEDFYERAEDKERIKNDLRDFLNSL